MVKWLDAKFQNHFLIVHQSKFNKKMRRKITIQNYQSYSWLRRCNNFGSFIYHKIITMKTISFRWDKKINSRKCLIRKKIILKVNNLKNEEEKTETLIRNWKQNDDKKVKKYLLMSKKSKVCWTFRLTLCDRMILQAQNFLKKPKKWWKI